MHKEKRNKLQALVKHPIQPLFEDENGDLRFKSNAIVKHLINTGLADLLNQLAMMDFSDEDREQFSQLHGYSLRGFGELRTTSDESYEAAVALYENPELQNLQARYNILEKRLKDLQSSLKAPIALLYGIHPDDLPTEETGE